MLRRIVSAGLGSSAALVFSFTSIALAQDAIVADGEQPGVRAEITELKRTSGDTVTLRFTVVNESGERFDVRSALGGNHFDARLIHFIDDFNKKKHMVVMDAAGKCVCSGALQALVSGKSVNLWARFPAPPADVTEVSVMIPKFIPVEVPVVD